MSTPRRPRSSVLPPKRGKDGLANQISLHAYYLPGPLDPISTPQTTCCSKQSQLTFCSERRKLFPGHLNSSHRNTSWCPNVHVFSYRADAAVPSTVTRRHSVELIQATWSLATPSRFGCWNATPNPPRVMERRMTPKEKIMIRHRPRSSAHQEAQELGPELWYKETRPSRMALVRYGEGPHIPLCTLGLLPPDLNGLPSPLHIVALDPRTRCGQHVHTLAPNASSRFTCLPLLSLDERVSNPRPLNGDDHLSILGKLGRTMYCRSL